MSDSEHRSEQTSPGDAVRPPRGVDALGQFIRSQRRIAELSQRELAKLADLSDAYLSQLERGLHEPSVRVVNGISSALNIPADKLFDFLRPGSGDTEVDDEVGDPIATAILTDERLTDAQKQSLLDVLRAFLTANGYDADGDESDER
ncbi:MAG: helix-turn-helix transcriptional regulator [Actinomycetota bacterium]